MNRENTSIRVGALIIKDGRLLTVKHKDYPFYYTVGGRLEFNETTEEGVIREVFEEIGCNIEVERLAVISESFFVGHDYDGKEHHGIGFYYLMKGQDCEGLDIADGTPTDQEREQLFWLDMNELEQFNLVPPFLKTSLKDLNRSNSVIHVVDDERKSKRR